MLSATVTLGIGKITAAPSVIAERLRCVALKKTEYFKSPFGSLVALYSTFQFEVCAQG